RKKAEQKIAKVNRARVAISTCNETLVRATDEVQLLQNICHIVVEQGGYRMAWVGYAEHDEDQTVCPVAWAGHEDGFLNSIIFSWADDDWDAYPVGVAICSSETKIVADINKDWNCTKCRDEAAKRGYASVIALPLLEDAAPFGALMIYSGECDDFDDEEIVLLQELADDLAYGVTALRTRDKRLKAEKEVAYLAFHDSLTGLPNRAMLMQSLDFVLAQADRDNRSVAILFIDLDQFKLVNDSLGHEAGDELLCRVAERLSKILRKSDIVARQGGDEFIVMLPDSGTHEGAKRTIAPGRNFGLEAGGVAQKIITTINEPYQIQGHETYVGASVGISLFPDDAKDVHTLLQHADSAMYYVKEQGRGDYHFYSHDLSERQQQRLSLETRLHKAIQMNELELYYQPIIDLKQGKIVGAEALIRWLPPDGVMVMPDEFIPVAEDSGMIVPIGHWMIGEACRQLRTWQDKGWEHHLAINLSVRQFWQNDLVTKIMEMVEATGIRHSLLQLEVTESALMTDPSRMESIMRDFDAHGFKISLDDFGTGYSSLSRLMQLPIHTLKIDKSFVDGVPHSADARAIVTTIVELARNLGIVSLAEGIETAEQWHYLRELGCKYGQGYYFSRPVPVSEINEMLERNQSW
ncbi:MAG: EAL domain-containing protein, partial [Gammaproteobacteria bacterium]|nr:EAL domain-containing protein [Gammaproteobacteria bacterium]